LTFIFKKYKTSNLSKDSFVREKIFNHQQQLKRDFSEEGSFDQQIIDPPKASKAGHRKL